MSSTAALARTQGHGQTSGPLAAFAAALAGFVDAEEAAGPLFHPPLWRQRRSWASARLQQHHAHSVLDVGCGEGALLEILLNDCQFVRLAGLDVDAAALDRCFHATLPSPDDHVSLREMPVVLDLYLGSLADIDDRLAGFDAIVALEVIEHLDPPELAAFAPVLLGHYRPRLAIVSTPNAEFNVHFPNLAYGSPDQAFRHYDHRFEWTRAEFEAWATAAAEAYDYDVEFGGVGLLAAGAAAGGAADSGRDDWKAKKAAKKAAKMAALPTVAGETRVYAGGKLVSTLALTAPSDPANATMHSSGPTREPEPEPHAMDVGFCSQFAVFTRKLADGETCEPVPLCWETVVAQTREALKTADPLDKSDHGMDAENTGGAQQQQGEEEEKRQEQERASLELGVSTASSTTVTATAVAQRQPLSRVARTVFPFFEESGFETPDLLDRVFSRIPFAVRAVPFGHAIPSSTAVAVEDLWSDLKLRQMCKTLDVFVGERGLRSPEARDWYALSADAKTLTVLFDLPATIEPVAEDARSLSGSRSDDGDDVWGVDAEPDKRSLRGPGAVYSKFDWGEPAASDAAGAVAGGWGMVTHRGDDGTDGGSGHEDAGPRLRTTAETGWEWDGPTEISDDETSQPTYHATAQLWGR
ncbi:hypothetical protein BC831DRAFT_457830 [Entophlyctis helioformis]|nr:hypothetical protein BC831DRAFT_457830 [Entophlyctis helioformis]